MKMKIALEKVAWDNALQELEKRYKKDKQWKWKRLEAEVSSLSALFITEFPKATRQISRAIGIEPFNPLHRYRLALLYMRFAQWDEALSVLDNLGNLLPKIAFPLYLRALIFLRTGQLGRAANIARDIKALRPDFTGGIFLGVEVQIRQKLKGAEGLFRELPKGERYLGIWADLLVKTVVANPARGAKVVEGFLKRSKVLPKGSIEEKLIHQIIDWNTASADVIKKYLVEIPPGSKTEQMALLFFHDHLKSSTEKSTYLNELKHLHDMLPHRNAVRRIYIAALNRYAVEEAAAEKYSSALTAVDICLRLEPFNIIHYQNRAALFTLLREKKSYHRAWEELDRLHYRLALLGRNDRQNTRLLVKRHRMFAQQARLTPKSADAKPTVNPGIFREERAMINGVEETVLAVNQQAVDSDPDQLRQWIHHRKAELFFSHLELGADPNLFLLGYSDDFSARTKLEGLSLLGQSLSVLAGEEGQLLARYIETCWRELVGKSSCGDAKKEENTEVRLLTKNHIETLGDLAMLCYLWEPKVRTSEIVDELIEFIEAEVLFLDAQALFGSMKGKYEEESYSISYLRQSVIKALDLKKTKSELSDQERKKVGRFLKNYLFLHLSSNVFKEYGATKKYAARRALEILEHARAETPDNLEIEFLAVHLFYFGDFYEEARKAIYRFYKVNKDDRSPYIAEVEKIQNALDNIENGNSEDYIVSKVNIRYTGNPSVERQLNNYKQELERFPSSIQTYEDIAHFMVFEGRFKEALEWSQRAIDRCLNRKGQLKPRMLNIEILGLQKLEMEYPDEIKLYLKGVNTPLKEVLEKISAKEPGSYELLYLLGICLWLEGEAHEAQKVFQEAYKNCDKKIHLTALHSLAVDVEQAFYTTAKEAIEQFIIDQRCDKAFEYIAKAMQKLKTPELMVIDLAVVQVTAVVAKQKHEIKIPKIPSIMISASWKADLDEVIREPDGLEKARRLTLLAMSVHNPSKKRGEEMLQQIEALKLQMDIAAVLTLSGKYLREGNFRESLQTLDSLGEEGDREPRVLRLRALILLKLGKFEQAEQVVNHLEPFEEPLAKSFISCYPTLKFWQKISDVQCSLKKGNPSEGLKILNFLQSPAKGEKLEAVYCFAFALSVQGYQSKLEGNHYDALKFFNEALRQLKPQIKRAWQNNHKGLPKLYEKLRKELNTLQEELHDRE